MGAGPVTFITIEVEKARLTVKLVYVVISILGVLEDLDHSEVGKDSDVTSVTKDVRENVTSSIDTEMKERDTVSTTVVIKVNVSTTVEVGVEGVRDGVMVRLTGEDVKVFSSGEVKEEDWDMFNFVRVKVKEKVMISVVGGEGAEGENADTISVTEVVVFLVVVDYHVITEETGDTTGNVREVKEG